MIILIIYLLIIIGIFTYSGICLSSLNKLYLFNIFNILLIFTISGTIFSQLYE